MRFYLALVLTLTPYFVCAQKQGQPLIDSLRKEVVASKDDTGKVILLNQLSITYSNINPDEGITLGENALALSNKLVWERGIAKAMFDLGINHQAKSHHSKALEYYQDALKRFGGMGDKGSVAETLAGIGLVYLAQSNYPKALEYDFRALDIQEALGNRKSSATILENIGTVYFEQKEYSKTTEYYTNALKIYNDLGDKESVANNLGNVGILLAAGGDYANALNKQLLALKIHEELGKISSIQVNLTNIGDDYNHLRDYPNAIRYQLRALKISQDIGNQNSVAINLGNIGETYFNIAADSSVPENAKKLICGGKTICLYNSIHYLKSAISICEETNFSGPIIEFSQCLSEAYFLSSDYKKAFESLKQHTITKDSVFSIQNEMEITKLEEDRKDELKDKEILIRDKEIQINELTISKKRDQQKLYIACIALLLFVVGLVLKSLYDYRRSNYVLEKEKRRHLLLIQKQVDRITKQTSVFNEISHMQSHDVRGPVATILGLVQIFNVDDFSDPTNKFVIEGITSVTKKLDEAVKDVIKKENSFNPRN